MSANAVAIMLVAIVVFVFSVYGFVSAVATYQRRDADGNVKVVRKWPSSIPREVEVPAHSEFAWPTITFLVSVALGYAAWRVNRADFGDWN